MKIFRIFLKIQKRLGVFENFKILKLSKIIVILSNNLTKYNILKLIKVLIFFNLNVNFKQ